MPTDQQQSRTKTPATQGQSKTNQVGWDDLVTTCQELGYKDAAHVLRTLFRGAYIADDDNMLEVARCIRAGMADIEIQHALNMGEKMVENAGKRLRDRMGAPGREGISVVATLYKLKPWDDHRTGNDWPENFCASTCNQQGKK